VIGRRTALRLTFLGTVALLPVACGRKGSIAVPEGEAERYTYPQTYPAPSTVVPNYEGPAEPAPGEALPDQPQGFEDVDDELSIDNQ